MDDVERVEDLGFHCDAVTPAMTANAIAATASRKRKSLMDWGRRPARVAGSSIWNGAFSETVGVGEVKMVPGGKEAIDAGGCCGAGCTLNTGSPDGARAAQAKQRSQPTSVQPNKKFRAKMNQRFC